MKKQIISAAIASALVLGAVPTAFADTTSSFTDIDNSFAKDAIQRLVEAGIINGVDSKHFDPKGELTRAQFVTLMVKAMNLPVDTSSMASNTFKDVVGWAAPYVDAAYKAGIIQGTGANAFSPNSNLTREQSTVIMVKALQTVGEIKGTGVPLTFTDADAISDWAKSYVAMAVAYGLIKGNPDGSFNPQGNATREQAAVMGTNFLKSAEEVKDENKPTDPAEPEQPPVVIPPVTGGGSTVDTQAPTLPQDVTVSDITETSVKVSWTASTDNAGAPMYKVYINAGQVFNSTDGTSMIVTGLTPDTDYHFEVRAYDAAGNMSNYTDPVSAHTVARPVAVSNVSLSSDNANNPLLAKVGDTVTLQFETSEEVIKLSNFKINGGNPTSFTCTETQEGGTWISQATYVIDESDPEGAMNFQINVKNAAGTYSQTIEQTTNGQYVEVQKAPVLSSVTIASNNANPAEATSGDTVTLTIRSAQKLLKLSNFKINGSNPNSFESVQDGNEWVTTATYVLDGTDPLGAMSFQINVRNEAGLYSVTTEATTDGSSVTVNYQGV
ncbi:S-layer homology domain-containing protein [Paenibacillus sp. UNC496MF]|uniref:S-layer homology domain-containing protein n=1 Tax=Paenibacillus sp. UNC496MF TaxID=1502753 RepID=UPI0008E098A1|nr:S-layer homology domain-containing protein [Paenibacillus sp. UNC496MF]SFJ57974.1 S-layer homology domain-containing protein [Paenibacillus sp. UNC496MF]